jgi:FkbM family methyltransferase
LNKIERVLDQVDPGLSVRLRTLKMRLRSDFDRRLIRDVVRPSEVCVDVGANRGVYTHIMSVRAGRAGHVHAVEPFRANCDRLRTIARRRGNITVHPLALSDHSGRGVLHIPVHDGHRIDALASLERRQTGEVDSCGVPLRTLDELLDGERRVSFLKCDAEGHEQRIFEGAAGILHRDRPVVFAEVEQRHREDPIASTFAFFTDAGYNGWFVTDGGLRALHEFDVTRDQVDFLDGRFIPFGMPAGYVYDFLFCPPGIRPPRWSLDRRR